ncbi:IS4 family transposase [Prevotella melaninogenica]
MDKGTTNSGIPVFGEVVKLLDRQAINQTATKFKANRYTKRLDGYQHLVIMLYSVLGQFNSLRELELGFYSSATRMNHFGLDYMVRRSTLSDANARRTPEFFEAVYGQLYRQYSSVLADSRPVKGLKRALFIMDSTTVSLFSQVFRGTGRNAANGRKKGEAKAHTVIKADEDVMVFMNITDAAASDHGMLDGLHARLPEGSCVTFDMGYVNYEAWQEFSDHDITYVTREKRKCRYETLETREIPEEDRDSVISDETVELSWRRRWKRPMTGEELSHRRGRRPKSGVVLVSESRSGRHKCRRITKWKDKRDEGTITFLTNDLDTPASVLCEVYRRRWQIETLFKRLKQNFPLKHFLGDNRNAIQIQIWTSMIAWLLMQVIKRQTRRKWSLSNLMTAVHILLNSYTGLYDFLDHPEGQWLKIIEARQKSASAYQELALFPPQRPPVFENQKTTSYLQGVTHEKTMD